MARPFLMTETGTSFASSGSLDNRVQKRIRHAGPRETALDRSGKPQEKASRSTHGIRKALATLAANNGCSKYELMAMFGWIEPKTAAVYTKTLDRAHTAKAGVAKRPSLAAGPRTTDRGPHLTANNRKTKENRRKWQPVGESNPSFQVENLAS